ncbi:MAG TPA: hypothetical protein VFE78_15960 [Gemmataceae bacterium]|jgi:hypothetical protein|nr:hypothetical protein [Gemmataceae bacterium]
MSLGRSVCAAVLAVALAAPAFSQGPAPIRPTLHPMAPSSPALRYRLLPELIGQTPGNAAEDYKKAVPLLNQVSAEDDAELQAWEKLPLEQLPCADVRRWLDDHKAGLDLIEQGARREYCDWGLTERLRKSGIGAVLPEIQPMRVAARLLALRARVEMAEGHFDQAAHTLRTGLALARHVGDSETLISFLVGNAVANVMANQIDLFVQQPKAPNLYWPLTDLPRPFIDVRKGMEGERVSIHGTFPGIAASATDLNAGPISEEQGRNYGRIFQGLQERNLPAGRALLALRLRKEYEADKQALVAQGRPRALVDRMPHVQVAVLRAFIEYDRSFDEMMKWQSFPYPEALPRLRQAVARRNAERKRSDTPLASELANLFLPNLDKIFLARARTDRKFAALRCVEAVRLYAAAHGGKLPPALGAIKEVPVPDDPMTGKPFVYTVAGGRATLVGPPPTADSRDAVYALTYELTLNH